MKCYYVDLVCCNTECDFYETYGLPYGGNYRTGEVISEECPFCERLLELTLTLGNLVDNVHPKRRELGSFIEELFNEAKVVIGERFLES